MRLMAFTDEQLAQIRDAVQPIPRAHRAAYLERVTALLAGRQFGNRDVQRSGRIGAARANRSSGYGMTRVDRFLARVDRELASIEPVARDAFLSRLIDHWEQRYAIWQLTEGESESCTDPCNPISAEDFVL